MTTSNVRVAIAGGIYTAPVGTASPSDSTTAYGAGWLRLGYISDAGIAETPNADWNEIRAWQNKTLVRRTLNSSSIEWKLTLIEMTKTANELYHAGSDITTAAGKSTMNVIAPQSDERAFAIDIIDGDTHERIVIPRGEVTSRGDLVYDGTTPIGFELTITAYASTSTDSSGNPIYAVKYSDDPAWALLSA